MPDDNNEQITKVPEPVRNITKEKVNEIKTNDPKKVAAGKKLAELNKKAKDALAREMKREADPEDKWLPELYFSTVLTVVGIGLTATDLFFRFYRSKKEKDSYDLTTTAITTATPETHHKKMSQQNKLVKTVTDSAVMVGLAAGVGYIAKKMLKENFLGDPSTSVMNNGKWTAILAGSMALKTYLEDQKILPKQL